MALQKPEWGLILGTWGDTICAMGHFQANLGSGNAVYYGNNEQIIEFVRCQPFIHRVEVVKEPSRERFYENVGLLWKSATHFEGLANVLEDNPWGLTVDDFVNTSVDWGYAQYDAAEIPIARGLAVTEDARQYAGILLSNLPKPVYLVQPYSINTNRMEHHWPFWREYIGWMLHDRGKHFVVCGQGWDSSWLKPRDNLTRLVNKCPSMTHVFALADAADAVISTSNSLAHYCASNDRPCIVVGTERSSEPTEYFHRVLRGQHLRLYNKFSNFWRVCLGTREFLSVWPTNPSESAQLRS